MEIKMEEEKQIEGVNFEAVKTSMMQDKNGTNIGLVLDTWLLW